MSRLKKKKIDCGGVFHGHLSCHTESYTNASPNCENCVSLVSYEKWRITAELLPSVEKPFGTLRTKKDWTGPE